MTIPVTGPINFSDFSVEVGQPTTYSASMSWIVSVTKPTQVPSPPNVNSYRGYSYYKRDMDGACSNGNCTVSGGNCGNINCVNCYISGTINCTNCDTKSYLQTGTNCIGAYNCTSGQFSTNCDCACACDCACDCAPPPACACDCTPPPACDCTPTPSDCYGGQCAQCSCFPAGCLVLLHNLTWKLIEEITIDDILMGADGNPVRLTKIDNPILGDRKMLSFAEDSAMLWSDEHPFWARHEDKQWLWVENHKNWIKEVDEGFEVGLKDNYSFLPKNNVEFANLNGGFDIRTPIDVTAERSNGYYTKLYLPVTENGSFIIVNGYVVSGGTNEFLFDYTKLDWNISRNIINKMIEGNNTK